jgi:hypothetical protein
MPDGLKLAGAEFLVEVCLASVSLPYRAPPVVLSGAIDARKWALSFPIKQRIGLIYLLVSDDLSTEVWIWQTVPQSWRQALRTGGPH